MNVLIVDDQISVINGLIKGLNWNKLGVTNVYKAYSAYEAKALFNNISIDLLLTDIEMPGENGISLVQWVRKQNFETECIFLTAHADFEYARDAIKVGTLEYILQPCPYEEIEVIVLAALEKIQQKKEQQKLYSYGKKTLNNTSMKSLMFYDCLNLNNNSVPLDFLISTGVFQDVDTKGYLTIFQIVKHDASFHQWDSGLLEFALHNIIYDIFEAIGTKILMVRTDTLVYAFFCYHASYIVPSQLFERQLEVLEDVLQRILKLTIEYRFSLININALHEQYKELNLSIMNNIPDPLSATNSDISSRDSEAPDYNPVNIIIQYINEHLEEDIMRSDLADLVHLNIDYLSRIFKKETGYTLNDYITVEKVKLAQKLIQTTILPIGLIASKVGYSNFSYFSKLYKKITNISPMEDRIKGRVMT